MTVKTLDRATVVTLTTPDLYWDTDLKGFGLKVWIDARGRTQRSWIVQYRVGKQQGKQKIGDAAKINADQARKRATEMLAKVTLGIDPAAEKRAARAATTLTLRVALEKYVEMKDDEVRQGLYRPSSFRVTKLYLLSQQYFGPLHRLSVNAVTRQAVAARLHEIRRATSDGTAGRARAQLAAAFTRLMQEGICESNPTIGTKAQQERPQRDRVLSNDELVRVWNACQNAGEYGAIVKLLILSSCRRSEIGGLRWSEIHDDAIHLPPERTKNGRAHVLPLTPMMRSIIENVPRMSTVIICSAHGGKVSRAGRKFASTTASTSRGDFTIFAAA
jgi:integrase